MGGWVWPRGKSDYASGLTAVLLLTPTELPAGVARAPGARQLDHAHGGGAAREVRRPSPLFPEGPRPFPELLPRHAAAQATGIFFCIFVLLSFFFTS